ncbi:MAG: GNAT family N-acetyltransferase [Firmicutes bacterium]|nr:GNAT family N-acetyltransferase [Bacillota bacterium]
MVELKEISADNFEECIRLSLSEEQRKCVASNAYSLSEAYALRNDGKYTPLPYAIYNGDEMVGFIMAVYQPIDEDDPEDDENVFYLSRTMIDQRYQGNGYGKQAVIKMIEILRSFPHGSAEAIVLSCNKENVIAYQLYRSLGFVDTGEYDEDGDVYCRLDLK